MERAPSATRTGLTASRSRWSGNSNCWPGRSRRSWPRVVPSRLCRQSRPQTLRQRATVDRRPIAGGIAGLVLILGAGFFAMFRGRPSESGPSESNTAAEPARPSGKAQTKGHTTVPRSDEERMVGRWQVVELDTPKRKLSRTDIDNMKPVWSFRESRLATYHLVNGRARSPSNAVPIRCDLREGANSSISMVCDSATPRNPRRWSGAASTNSTESS